MKKIPLRKQLRDMAVGEQIELCATEHKYSSLGSTIYNVNRELGRKYAKKSVEDNTKYVVTRLQ